MRFAAIADVHGNYLALEAVLADIRAQGVEGIVNLGDMAMVRSNWRQHWRRGGSSHYLSENRSSLFRIMPQATCATAGLRRDGGFRPLRLRARDRPSPNPSSP